MRKAILVLMMLMLATPVMAKEYRVRMDLLFETEAKAIQLMNWIETNKADILCTGLNGNEPDYVPCYAEFIDSYDLETPPKAGVTRHTVNLSAASATYVVENTKQDLQSRVDIYQAKIDAMIAKAAAWQATVDAKQAEIDLMP